MPLTGTLRRAARTHPAQSQSEVTMEPRRQQLLKTAKLQGWVSVPNEILESPRPPRGEEEKQQKQLNSLFWSRTYLEQS